MCLLYMRLSIFENLGNDPSAGSPTETLLRLLLPLNVPVRTPFRRSRKIALTFASPRHSLVHSIGSSDGRCVQRAGTYFRWAEDPTLQRYSLFVGYFIKPQAQASCITTIRAPKNDVKSNRLGFQRVTHSFRRRKMKDEPTPINNPSYPAL